MFQIIDVCTVTLLSMNPSAGLSDELVWIATYGTDIRLEEFLKYINGGIISCPGAAPVPGCQDKSPPRKMKPWIIPNLLTFSRYHFDWKGAFLHIKLQKQQFEHGWKQLTVEDFPIESDHNIVRREEIIPKEVDLDRHLLSRTFGRIYLVTVLQAQEIFAQQIRAEEQSISSNAVPVVPVPPSSPMSSSLQSLSEEVAVAQPILVKLDFPKLKAHGSQEFGPGMCKSVVLLVGDHVGYPILSLTSAEAPEYEIGRRASPLQVSLLGKGIRQVYDWSEDTIIRYLRTKAGVLNHYPLEEIRAILNAKFNGPYIV